MNGTVYTVFLAPRVLFASHVMLLSILIKQTLGSLDLPLLLEPRGLYRADGERPDGVTMGVYASDLIAAGLMELDLTVRSNFQI